jgi:hypothetical protein
MRFLLAVVFTLTMAFARPALAQNVSRLWYDGVYQLMITRDCNLISVDGFVASLSGLMFSLFHTDRTFFLPPGETDVSTGAANRSIQDFAADPSMCRRLSPKTVAIIKRRAAAWLARHPNQN